MLTHRAGMGAAAPVTRASLPTAVVADARPAHAWQAAYARFGRGHSHAPYVAHPRSTPAPRPDPTSHPPSCPPSPHLAPLPQAVEDMCTHKMQDSLYKRLQAACDAHIKRALASLQAQVQRRRRRGGTLGGSG